MKARIRRTRKIGGRRQSAIAITMNRQNTLSQRRLSEKGNISTQTDSRKRAQHTHADLSAERSDVDEQV